MSSDYDHLTLMQKVEVFEQAIDSTSGDDLAKVLWLKSPSSEVRSYYYYRRLRARRGPSYYCMTSLMFQCPPTTFYRHKNCNLCNNEKHAGEG